MPYRRGDEGPAAAFYRVDAGFHPEAPPAIRRFVSALEAQTKLPRRGVSTWPTDSDSVERTAQAFARAADNLFFAGLDLASDDAAQLDRFALEFLVDPQVRGMFDDGRLREPEAANYAALRAERRNLVPNEPLLYYAMGCFWGEWLVRQTSSRWFLFAPLLPLQSFPDMLRTGSLTALSPFSLATKLLADPAESLAGKVAAMPEGTLFGPVALCASISDSEEILRRLVGPKVEEATRLLKQGKNDAAFRLLDKAIDADPGNGHLLFQAAILGWEHKRFEFIHRATALQLELAPRSAEIRHNFAAIESMREGGLEPSIAMLEELVAEDPDYARARLTLASSLLEAGRRDEARRHAQWVVDHDAALAPQARGVLDESLL